MIASVLSQGGRVVVPKIFRAKLGVKEGDELIWMEVDGWIVLTSRRQQLEHAQALFAELFKDYRGSSLVDELIADRRAEAARDDAEADAAAEVGSPCGKPAA